MQVLTGIKYEPQTRNEANAKFADVSLLDHRASRHVKNFISTIYTCIFKTLATARPTVDR
jgi:hypothetical protein